MPPVAQPVTPPSVDGPKGGVSSILSSLPCLPIASSKIVQVCVYLCVCVGGAVCVRLCSMEVGREGLSLLLFYVSCVKHFVLHVSRV